MIFFPIVLVVIALYLWTVYNRFVTTKTRIKASIQEIGNQLKRQTDLIPNLVESVKGYMKHEKGIFDKLTEARKKVISATSANNLGEMIKASNALNAALSPINALMESNPEIKAAGTVSQLMEELRDTADKVMYSRRTLIDLTADYNIMLVTFPSSLVAKLFSFSQEKGLETPEGGKALKVIAEEEEVPKVKLE